MLGKLFDRLLGARPWYRLPGLLAALKIIRIRNELRERNLYDTEELPFEKVDPAAADPKYRQERTLDGTYNDLAYPRMGSAGTRFGRNFALEHTRPETGTLLDPNPRAVSQKLMTRHAFQPATSLNLMAASWIQFMVHDWFVHEQSDSEHIEVPGTPGDRSGEPGGYGAMRVPRTRPDPAPAGSTRPPAYRNLHPHWWDGSQVYGANVATASRLRTFQDGRLRIRDDGLSFVDEATGIDIAGVTDNWWIGLSMLHALFTREHNAICDRLKSLHPGWSDDALYAKARLINAALLAKIHTVEWTPAILAHPYIKLGMNVQWSGLLGERIQDLFKPLNRSDVLGGVIGSETDHYTAPYSMTEEFVAIYRMHPLMPDEFVFRSAATGEVLARYSLPEVAGRNSRPVVERHSMTDLFYSFGVSHPGAITLHNYPRHLQNLERDGKRIDLAMVDVLRDRERGVPRYNQFRRLLRKEPVTSFEELTDNPEWREEIRALYGNDIEKVDLMVGLYAEPLPEGFGFSETAFRVFLLMAGRRLKSDRFFASDHTPEVYTRDGIDYIRENGMASVLRRHLPSLAPALRGVDNPFAPWRAVAGTAPYSGH